jgi:hypothetical protein
MVPDKWYETLLKNGPVGVIALGGLTALTKGLLPVFELQEAIFGASLLLIAAFFYLLVWYAKVVWAEKNFKDANKIAEEEKKKKDAAIQSNPFGGQGEPR